jgi:hypothetical protein
MLVEHRGATPRVAATAYDIPTHHGGGRDEIGDECRIMFGAVLVAASSSARGS